MKKKILIGVIVVIILFVGSAAISGIYQGITGKGNTDKQTDSDNKTIEELSKTDKDKIKKQVEEKVKDKNVTDVSILTEPETGKPIISLQLKGDIEKANVNKEEIEKIVYELEDRVKDISDKVEIQMLDKNNQVILLYMNKEIEYY